MACRFVPARRVIAREVVALRPPAERQARVASTSRSLVAEAPLGLPDVFIRSYDTAVRVRRRPRRPIGLGYWVAVAVLAWAGLPATRVGWGIGLVVLAVALVVLRPHMHTG